MRGGQAPRGWRVWVLLLLASSGALGLDTVARTSPTNDEGKHIATGVHRVRSGRCCLGRDNGPTLAWNALLLAPRTLPGAEHLEAGEDPWKASRRFLLAQPDLDRFVERARLPSVALLVGLCAIVFAWSRWLYGPAGALVSLFLCALSPNLLAHGSLATGDIHAAFFMTLAAWTWARFASEPGAFRLAAAGVCLGLALAAKYSALVLVPSLAVASWLGAPQGRGGGRLARQGVALGVALALAALVVWLAYGATSDTTSIHGRSAWLPGFADYLDGLARVRRHASEGWNAYLLGEHRRGGWWYYFPVALAVKTPLPALLALAAAVLLSPWIASPGWRRELFVWLPGAALLGTAMLSSHNIGVRHLLPLLPLVHVFCGRLVGLRVGSPRLRAALLAAGAAWTAGGTVLHHPHHLAFFNEAAGGPAGGHRILADSNLDWGQDLEALRDYLRREGVPAVRLAYAGPVPPGRYGIRYQPLPSFDAHPEDPVYVGGFGPRELVVVSAYNLLGIHPGLRNTYAWLRSRTPVARPGYSLFVYDVTDDFEAHREIIRLYERSGRADLAALERQRLRDSGAGDSASGR